MVESDRDSEVGLLVTRVVKEVVDRGLETSLRDPIVEAVEESDAGSSGGLGLPAVGALLAGAGAVGFAIGRRWTALLEDVVPEEVEIEPELEPEPSVDVDVESEDADRSWVRRGLVLVGVVGAIALLRRRFSGRDEPEWEPIEEFQPAPGTAGSEEEAATETDLTESAESDNEE